MPVTIARYPGQVMPLSGSWYGNPGEYLGVEAASYSASRLAYQNLAKPCLPLRVNS